MNPLEVGVRAHHRVTPTILIYQATLLTIAVTLLVLALPKGVGNPFAVLGLAAVAALAERGRVLVGKTTQVSISVLPTVFAAAVFGPLAAIIVAAGSFLGDFPLPVRSRGTSDDDGLDLVLKWGVYTCIRSIYGAAAGFAAFGLAPLLTGGLARVVIATVIAGIVAEPLDVAFVALTLRIRSRRVWPFVRMYIPMLLVSVSLYTPIVALLAIAYTRVSPWTLALFLVPALAAQRLFGLYQQQLRLTAQLVDANKELETATLSFAIALVTTLDARDRYTAGHSAAVAIYARDIARRMGLSDREAQVAHLAGLVHDIGKIGLSAGLLEKPDSLSLEERREMQRHSEIGERILAKVDTYAEIACIVRHHHERLDGSGYPDKLSGEQIPLISRILAVADAYNAMTSDRPYRDAMPSRVARVRLAQAVDSQFDTSVVAAFEAILAGAHESYRLAASPEFTFASQEPKPASFGTRPVSAAISA